MKKLGFTLAEVLITLAIIGVVAAISIPSVVANTQQKEFQTGLRKAVSVLNSAITMNMAIDGESPYENQDLYNYLQRHMSVMKKDVVAPISKEAIEFNYSFYTTDGMRFEFPYDPSVRSAKLPLQENPDIFLRGGISWGHWKKQSEGLVTPPRVCSDKTCAHCGSYGLISNTDNTTTEPCLVVVDVNGDRKPFPKNATCFNLNSSCHKENIRKFGELNGTKLTDTFSIMITDKQAIPYGVVAQRAMYQAQSKEK